MSVDPLAMDDIGQAAARAAKLFETIRALPVTGPARSADLAQHLEAAYRFEAPMPSARVLDDVAAMLERGAVQVTHPAYFGLFNPSVHPSAIAASTLVAAYNPQCASYSHSPAALQMEQHALAWLAARLGYDPDASAYHVTSGGQEANTEALATALTSAFPEVRDEGLRALSRPPVLYVSAEAHHSFEKAAHLVGLGRAAVRRVPVDAALCMDVDALRAAIAADRAKERAPFFVVGTVGATSSGVIDPLAAIADVADRESLWLHVDAAWGGIAVLSDRLRRVVEGIERASSITWDAQKGLAVPFGAGMLFTRHPDALRAQFATASPYMPAPSSRADPYETSHQWTRRAGGVPLFATLATLGGPGLSAMIDHQCATAGQLRARLLEAGFRVEVETPLPLVCFAHRSLEAAAIARAIQRRARAWISATRLADGRPVLRACITSYRTEERDLDVLLDELALACAR